MLFLHAVNLMERCGDDDSDSTHPPAGERLVALRQRWLELLPTDASAAITNVAHQIEALLDDLTPKVLRHFAAQRALAERRIDAIFTMAGQMTKGPPGDALIDQCARSVLVNLDVSPTMVLTAVQREIQHDTPIRRHIATLVASQLDPLVREAIGLEK